MCKRCERTKKTQRCRLTYHGRLAALDQRIASEPIWAAADRLVAQHSALGAGGAEAGAWVHAARVQARLVGGAVRVLYALGTALRVRVTVIVGHAFTRAGTVALGAQSIRAAGIGMARIGGSGWQDDYAHTRRGFRWRDCCVCVCGCVSVGRSLNWGVEFEGTEGQSS